MAMNECLHFSEEIHSTASLTSALQHLIEQLLLIYDNSQPFTLLVSSRAEAPRCCFVNNGELPDFPQYYPNGWLEEYTEPVIWLRIDRILDPEADGDNRLAALQEDLLHEFAHHIDVLHRGIESPEKQHDQQWIQCHQDLRATVNQRQLVTS